MLWLVDGISLLVVARLLPGVSFVPADTAGKVVAALTAAFILGLVNLLIRPLILMIARPLGGIAILLIGFLVNAVMLELTAWLIPGFEVADLLSALLGGIFFAAVNVVLTSILDVDEEGSIYQNRIERQARKDSHVAPGRPGRGLVMVEIDGLSYHHLKHALDSGADALPQELDRQARATRMSRVDCGIPSQTSACQAGIMFGDNYDIPAFRWYDKDKQKLYVSASDATEINSRYAKGNGLMRGGTSISNMMNGDAAKSLLTLADLRTADAAQKKRRAQDIYLLMLNPYFLMRAIVLFFVEVVRELWQGWRQARNDVQPRLNRLHQLLSLRPRRDDHDGARAGHESGDPRHRARRSVHLLHLARATTRSPTIPGRGRATRSESSAKFDRNLARIYERRRSARRGPTT